VLTSPLYDAVISNHNKNRFGEDGHREYKASEPFSNIFPWNRLYTLDTYVTVTAKKFPDFLIS